MLVKRLSRLEVFALMPFAASIARADFVYTFNVTSTADVADANPGNFVCETGTGNGVCTLRAAVMEANALAPGGQQVQINLPAGDYVLTIPRSDPNNDTNGDLDMVGWISLVGAGAAVTTINASHLDRAIITGVGSTIGISGVTIEGGRRPYVTVPQGGGIYNSGALTLTRCVVVDNQTASGTDANGGGIYTHAGSLSLIETTVQSNVSGFDGGGIYASSGTVTIVGSTIRSNKAYTFGAGGGIWSEANTTISGSTLNGNTAYGGGGVWQEGLLLRVTNSTIVLNGSADNGGGFFINSSTPGITFSNVTLVANSADTNLDGVGEGSGIYLVGATVTLTNSIVNNSNDFSRANDDCAGSGSLSSNGHNILLAPGTCVVNGTVSTVAPQLDLHLLTDNGGPTATWAPAAASPAISAGAPGGCTDPLGATLTTDQRGVKRPIGTNCDLGAVEVEPIGDANGDGVVDVADVFYLINYLFAGGPIPLGRANVNGDSAIDVSDVFYLINYLFAGGPAPV
jgi:CSLREA domain-containing protein